MSAVPFEVLNLRRQDKDTFNAFFDVSMPGVVVRNCRYHVGRRGAFIAGPSMRSQFAVGGYQKHAEFDYDLAEEIQDVIEARLAADEGGEHAA